MGGRYRAFIIDLDGSVYLGDRLVGGSDKAVKLLLDRGVKVLFLTNNSSYTSRDYCEKLRQLGVPCKEDMVLTSGEAAARYILSISGPSKILPITGKGFIEYCELVGHMLVSIDRWWEAEYVVVGLDRGLTYEKLRAAVRAIYRGARFVATNTDRTLPTPGGPDPGAGAIVAAIKEATGVEPTVIGKPSKLIMDVALKTLGLGAKDVLVVGDRVETDVRAGKAIGADTAILLTGVTRLEDLERLPQEDRPTYVAEGLLSLVKKLYSREVGSG